VLPSSVRHQSNDGSSCEPQLEKQLFHCGSRQVGSIAADRPCPSFVAQATYEERIGRPQDLADLANLQ
jgi:hypothetical protein